MKQRKALLTHIQRQKHQLFHYHQGKHHNIALNLPKRANYRVPPTRYGFEDMVAYVLQVAEEVDRHEPSPKRKLLLVQNLSNGLLVWQMR